MMKLHLCLLLATAPVWAQDVWVEPRVREMPALKAAPYVALKDGSVLTVEGDNAYITRDDGNTWSQPIPLFPDGQLKVSRERALLRTRDGVLLLAFMNLADRYWAWDEEKKAAKGQPRLDVWVVRSLDEGRTWRDAQKVLAGYCGAVRQMIQTRAGRIILIAQDYLNDGARHITVTLASDDQGLRWRKSNIIDLGGRGHHDGAIEATVAELGDGRLWMLLRTNWDYFWEAFSSDGGLYWRTIQPTRIAASSSPAYLARLASGRLVMAWNQLYPEGHKEYERRAGSYSEQAGSWNREELSIAFSDNEARSWTPPVVIARKPKARLSYPWIFERRPGELWITTMQGDLRLALRESDFVRATPARVVTFGDSLTAPRAGVTTFSEILAKELPLRGVPVEVINAGVPGNTTTQARARFQRDVLERRPDLVIIQLGMNDAAVDVWKQPPASAPRVSLFEFRENLQFFVDTLRQRNTRIVLIVPNRLVWTDKLRSMYGKPPYSTDSDAGFNVILDAYGDVIRGIARRERIPLVDAAAAVPPSALLDGMHPSSDGHRLIADLLLDVVAGILGSN